MRGAHNIFRLIRTGATFERTGAMRVVLGTLDLHPNLRILARAIGLPFSLFGLRGDRNLAPVPRALTALGPAYIKFGQLLSTRPDVVGNQLSSELRVLLDKLPPFATDEARRMVESELGIKVDEEFSYFSDSIAAASIAQVHRATLHRSGQDVAVKVLRPNIERAFRRDIDAFYFAAWLVRTFAPASRRLRPREVVEHFEGVVMRELDLRMEAAAADELAATASVHDRVLVPTVRWEFSGKRVVTVDWAEGINLGNVDELSEAGHDLPDLAARLIQMFLRQALRDGYFHADLHQGNLKVSAAGEFVMLDFGIMGRINTFTRRVYAEILMGFIEKDYHRVAEVHFEAGYVPADQDIDDFAQALRSVGEPMVGMDASRISMARLLAHLFEVTERFGMQTRTELILLQRTMVVVEGVARSLDPHLNMWDVARPVVEGYIRDQVGPRAVIRDLVRSARTLSRLAPQLPELLAAASRRLEPAAVDPPPSFRLKLLVAGLSGSLLTLLILIIYGV